MILLGIIFLMYVTYQIGRRGGLRDGIEIQYHISETYYSQKKNEQTSEHK